jgi:hypothetical protein
MDQDKGAHKQPRALSLGESNQESTQANIPSMTSYYFV